jgi:hypothetical protein
MWLILGPSGVGKSSFGAWLAVERNWLHLEIDRFPEDGINLHNLRTEWNEFCERGNPGLFAEVLQRRLAASSKTNCVLTFPGCLILPPGRIVGAAKLGVRTIYLYGSAAHCITAFLEREEKKDNRLGLDHWISNSHKNGAYIEMSKPALAPYRIHVCTHMGERIQHAKVFEALLNGGQFQGPGS